MPYNNFFPQYAPYPQQTPGYQMPTTQNQQNFRPAQTAGNKVYVTSQEDALSRFVEPGSVMVYIRQDEQVEYEVYSDFQGRKNIVVYTRTPQTGNGAPVGLQGGAESTTGEYITEDKYNAMVSRIEALERAVNGGKNE